MATCPTCGQPIPSRQHLNVDALLDILQNGVPHREVYTAQDGGWYVTYGGGRTTAAAVMALVRSGAIVSVYDNYPGGAYHVGKTLDMTATTEERKKHRRCKDAPLIYTDGTHEMRT